MKNEFFDKEIVNLNPQVISEKISLITLKIKEFDIKIQELTDQGEKIRSFLPSDEEFLLKKSEERKEIVNEIKDSELFSFSELEQPHHEYLFDLFNLTLHLMNFKVYNKTDKLNHLDISAEFKVKLFLLRFTAKFLKNSDLIC